MMSRPAQFLSSLTGLVRQLAIINPALKRWAITTLNPGAFEKRAQHFFGFEELAGDFAGGEGVASVIGVDLADGIGDFG